MPPVGARCIIVLTSSVRSSQHSCVDVCQVWPDTYRMENFHYNTHSKPPKELNEFRPVALKSLVMKNFEKILKDKVVSLIDGKLDPLQFAYQAGKGVDDTKLLILDRVYKHLEKPKSHLRLLFANFSSAFNKMQPHILLIILSYLTRF